MKPAAVPGDYVMVTGDQSYEITWDDAGYAGETGLLLEVDRVGLSENARTGTRDCAPYRVLLDDGRDVYVADVKSAEAHQSGQ